MKRFDAKKGGYIEANMGKREILYYYCKQIPFAFAYLQKKGVFGRRRLIEYYLGKFNRTEVEEDCKNENLNIFHTARIWRCFGATIGEFIPRYIILMKTLEQMNCDGIKDILFVPDYCDTNEKILELMDRRITVIGKSDELELWRKKLLKEDIRLDFSYFDYLRVRYQNDEIFDFDSCIEYLTLNEEDVKEFHNLRDEIGIGEKQYVAISNRDNSYMLFAEGSINLHGINHEIRNSNITSRNLAVDYLRQQDICVVRVGKVVEARYDYGGCIDYASDYHSDKMDIYIPSEAKFTMSDSNGLGLISFVFCKYHIFVNVTPLLGLYSGCPVIHEGLIIFKKYWNVKEDRQLTFYEMEEVEWKMNFLDAPDGNILKERGIFLIDNTPEEIRDVVIEMNKRIDGTWVETDEDIYRQNKVNEFRNEIINKRNIKKGSCLWMKIGTQFLKDNWEALGL